MIFLLPRATVANIGLVILFSLLFLPIANANARQPTDLESEQLALADSSAHARGCMLKMISFSDAVKQATAGMSEAQRNDWALTPPGKKIISEAAEEAKKSRACLIPVHDKLKESLALLSIDNLKEDLGYRGYVIEQIVSTSDYEFTGCGSPSGSNIVLSNGRIFLCDPDAPSSLYVPTPFLTHPQVTVLKSVFDNSEILFIDKVVYQGIFK